MRWRLCVLVLISSGLGGCLGLTTPDLQAPTQSLPYEVAAETTIVRQVKCEIRHGVQLALLKTQIPGYIGIQIDWFRKWVAKVTLKIVVDEKSAITPGLSVGGPFANAVNPFPTGGSVVTGQSFNFGFGGQVSADATRTESIGFTYPFEPFSARDAIPSLAVLRASYGRCHDGHEILVEGDLKIADFINTKLELAKQDLVGLNQKEPFDVFSYETSFVTLLNANATPTWKFVQVTANTASPFISASRQKTDDVLITLGPAVPSASTPGKAVISPQGDDVHFANLIGQAVATAIQSQQP